MATTAALQQTGTTILAGARYFAQDQSANNPAVSASDALDRLNDRLVWWQNNVEDRPKTLSAATTGLTFAPGDTTKVVTNDTGIVNILSAHQTSSTSITYPLGRRLQRKSVEEIYDMYDLLPGQSVSQVGNQIQFWAAELDQSQQDDWRVLIYPALNTTLSLNLRVSMNNTLGNIGDTADVSPAAARVISRLLAYDLAGVQKQNDPAYLQWILSGIPQNIMEKAFGAATKLGAQQSSVKDYGSMSY